MKHIITTAAIILVLCMLCSCAAKTDMSDTVTVSTTVTDEQPAIFNLIADYYILQSGVGAWRTVLKVNDDGSIEGRYLCGSAGGPEICDFTGRFTDVQKLDDYSYSVKLESVEYAEPGNVFRTYEDGTEMHTAEPYGLYSYDTETVTGECIIYLPGAPESSFDEDFEGWAKLNGVSCSPVLDSYVIYNLEGKFPFFESDEQTYTAIITA